MEYEPMASWLHDERYSNPSNILIVNIELVDTDKRIKKLAEKQMLELLESKSLG